MRNKKRKICGTAIHVQNSSKVITKKVLERNHRKTCALLKRGCVLKSHGKIPQYVCQDCMDKAQTIAKTVSEIETAFNEQLQQQQLAENRMPAEDGDNSGAILKIGTHNGTFHCDEVLACFMLRLLDEYRDAAIVRTRDEAKLAECDIVVDVGAVYDAGQKRFDHHQRTFGETMNSIDPANKWTTKLSSAGLVYCHYGKAVLKSLMGKAGEDESVVSLIYGKVYENFVQEIDAIDNGIDQYDGEMRYRISTNLSSRVAHLNPSWNEEKPDEQAAFNKAMVMVGKEFVDRVSHYISVWLPARDIVEKSFLARHKVDAGGQVMELCRFCPWKEHLFAIEKEHGVEGEDEIKYVIYQDQAGNWRLQCVPKGSNTFENRLSIKAEWRGVRNEELSKLSGISGCIFVHANGFIAGTKTRDGVLEMARKSLESSS